MYRVLLSIVALLTACVAASPVIDTGDVEATATAAEVATEVATDAPAETTETAVDEATETATDLIDAEEAAVRSLAHRSDPETEGNGAGLISLAQLEHWLTDWKTHQPAGITGRLIILQRDDAGDGLGVVAHQPDVRVYMADDLSMLLQTRSNGLLSAGLSPARGTRVDSYLRRYGIDPTSDLVVLAQGRASLAGWSDLARAWLTLRYWGVDHAHLALLDGSVSKLSTALRSAVGETPPIDGAMRVVSLPNDGFALLADTADVRRAVLEGDAIIDTRAAEAFEGAQLSAAASDSSCLAGVSLCTSLRAGRIAGARHLPVASLLAADGTQLQSVASLEALLAGLRADDRPVIVYDADGHESALAAFVMLGVTGTPARWYAGGFVEWSALTASHPDPALRLLPDAPAGTIVVAESGITSNEDVQRLEEAGVDAILVGEALMREDDPAAAVHALLGSRAPE